MKTLFLSILLLTTSCLSAFDDPIEIPINGKDWYVVGIDDYSLNKVVFLNLFKESSNKDEHSIILIQQLPGTIDASALLIGYMQPYQQNGFSLVNIEANPNFARAFLKRGSYCLAFRIYKVNNRIYGTCLGLENDLKIVKAFYENIPTPHQLKIKEDLITIDDKKFNLLPFGEYEEPFPKFKIAFPIPWTKEKNSTKLPPSTHFWSLSNTGATCAIIANFFPAPLENLDEEQISKSAVEALKQMSKGKAQEFKNGRTDDGHPFVYTSFKATQESMNAMSLFLVVSKKGFYLLTFYDTTSLTNHIAMKQAIVAHIKIID